MVIVEIKRNDAGQRLDKFITKTYPNMPKSMMYKFIRTKKIKLNRKRAEISDILNEGDIIHLFVNEEFLIQDGKAQKELFKNIKPVFDVAYEDKNILICNKPVGLLCHSDKSNEYNTLIEQVKAYLWRKGEYDPKEEKSFAPALCNRIDRNTCGLVIAAKNAESLRELNDQIKNRDIKKYYVCKVHGVPKTKEATLEGYLIKNEKDNLVKIYKKKPSEKLGDAKKVITAYKVISDDGKDALLEIDLITGRTHQIRAHMSSIGHPLVGDGKYANNKADREEGTYRQELCSYKVEFTKKDGVLGYLCGKKVELKLSSIEFCKDFIK